MISKLAIQLAGKDIKTVRQYLGLAKSTLNRAINALEGETMRLEGSTSDEHTLSLVTYRLGQAKAASKLLDGLIDEMAGIDKTELIAFEGVENE